MPIRTRRMLRIAVAAALIVGAFGAITWANRTHRNQAKPTVARERALMKAGDPSFVGPPRPSEIIAIKARKRLQATVRERYAAVLKARAKRISAPGHDSPDLAARDGATAAPPRDSSAKVEARRLRIAVKRGVKEIETMRKIPGAAPLVDEIVRYLRRTPHDAVLFRKLPRNPKTGRRSLDEATAANVVQDPVVREKWLALMTLAAGYDKGTL